MKPTLKGLYSAEISEKVKDHSKDPYVVRKTKTAKKNLDAYGLPDKFIQFRAERLKK